MCDLVIRAKNSVCDSIGSAGNFVATKVTNLGRRIEVLTDTVTKTLLRNESLASIGKKLVYAAPFAAAHLVTPLYIQGAVLGAVVGLSILYTLAENGALINDSLRQTALRGLGLAWLVRAGQEIVKIATRQSGNPVALMIQLFAASFLIGHSGLEAKKEIVEAKKDESTPPCCTAKTVATDTVVTTTADQPATGTATEKTV